MQGPKRYNCQLGIITKGLGRRIIEIFSINKNIKMIVFMERDRKSAFTFAL